MSNTEGPVDAPDDGGHRPSVPPRGAHAHDEDEHAHDEDEEGSPDEPVGDFGGDEQADPGGDSDADAAGGGDR